MKTAWVTRTVTGKPAHLPAGWQALNFPLLEVTPPSHPPTPPKSDDASAIAAFIAVDELDDDAVIPCENIIFPFKLSVAKINRYFLDFYQII